jgi:prepilin-type processing-associated H-X9-DG protein
VAGGVVGAAITMPALSRARGQATSTVSMSNLKQIALALLMYSDDHDGRFPDDLQAARSYFGSSKVLESPRKPKGFEGESYIYIGGQSLNIDSPARQILAYENPEFCDDKISVAFMDGHVESMSRDRFLKAIEQTYKRLGRPVPEIQFKGETGNRPQEDTGPTPDTRP